MAKLVLLCIAFCCSTTLVLAENLEPRLHFSDLISGPDHGIRDGKGVGTIVTLWGSKLISNQHEVKAFFKDSKGVERPVAWLYYLKNADGKLPSGPADLYTSHAFEELAVSIPDSSNGLGWLYLKIGNKESNKIEFTVRNGNIYHVKPSGSNNASGSFDNPWKTVSKTSKGAITMVQPGDLIYLHHGLVEKNGNNGKNKSTGIYISGHDAGLASQTAIVAYPNARVLVQGENRAVSIYKASGLVISKVVAKAGNFDIPKNNKILPKNISAIGINTSANGRIVGNEITQISNKCVSGQQGAITGNARSFDAVSKAKILGNYIHDWGCDQSSHFGHVTYLSNRSDGKRNVAAWEYGWNHLLNNKSKFGLHSYDETYKKKCGNVDGILLIHHNLVMNQRGAGINIGAKNSKGVCWNINALIYNNRLVNTGLGPKDENGVVSSALRFTDQGLAGTIHIFNNTVHTWGADGGGRRAAIELIGKQKNIRLIVNRNIFKTDLDVNFTSVDRNLSAQIQGSSNAWIFTDKGADLAIQPQWDEKPITKQGQCLKKQADFLHFDKVDRKIPSLNVDLFGQVARCQYLGAWQTP